MNGPQIHEMHRLESHRMDLDRELRSSAIRRAARSARETDLPESVTVNRSLTAGGRKRGWLQLAAGWDADLFPTANG